MTNIAKKDASWPGFSYDWTEIAYQEEKGREGAAAYWVFPLCVLFVFLQPTRRKTTSFALSLSIILIVPMCLLCGIAGVHFRRSG